MNEMRVFDDDDSIKVKETKIKDESVPPRHNA